MKLSKFNLLQLAVLGVLLAPAAHAFTISQNVRAIEQLLNEKPRVYKTRSSVPIQMLREYAFQVYGNEVHTIDFLVNQRFSDVDSNSIGTMVPRGAFISLRGSISYRSEFYDHKDDMAQISRANAIVHDLFQGGAVFGFDGIAQNGCAGPEDLLLILDPMERVVYMFEMEPCRE